MKNNYWSYNNLIRATNKEMEDLVRYEIDMFRETCRQLKLKSKPKSVFEKNLFIESLAIHTRLLVEFFYNKKKYPNDLVAQDLLPTSKDWVRIRPLKTQSLEDVTRKADKQLAHLSRWRFKIERDCRKRWDYITIEQDMERIIQAFEGAIGKEF